MLRIKFFRLSRNLSQWETAKAAGMSQGRYSMIERGQIEPTKDECERIAHVLGCSAPTLFRQVLREPKGNTPLVECAAP